MPSRSFLHTTTVLTFALSLAARAPIHAALQTDARVERPVPSRPTVAEPAANGVEEADADQTREQFEHLLQRYPPGVARVLKLDPSLMTNESYLASYPGLGEFMTRHPGVVHNPSFYLERVRVGESNYGGLDPREARRWNMIGDILGGTAALIVFGVVTGTIIWLVRIALQNRRWNRVSKTQTEIHSKLMDRLGSNEELMAYMQTPAGRRFLEFAPVPLEPEPKRLAAPFSRILWSLQAGAVLTVAGLGLLFLRANSGIEEISQVAFIFGVLILSIGIGFVVSAAVAYLLSKRLGLFDATSASEHA
jgi:hypothetical protein